MRTTSTRRSPSSIEKYGPLSSIWFDVPQVYGPEHGVPLLQKLRKLQPDLLFNNRAYQREPEAAMACNITIALATTTRRNSALAATRNDRGPGRPV